MQKNRKQGRIIEKKIKILLLVFIAIFGISITSPISARSKNTTIPKSLRGTWYSSRDGSFLKVQVTTHSVKEARSSISAKGKLKHFSKLRSLGKVTVKKYRKGYGATNYKLFLHNSERYWVGKRKIHGHYQKVLKSYHPVTYKYFKMVDHPIRIYTKKFSKTDYDYANSYSYKRLMKEIGK